MADYSPQSFEGKWQHYWEAQGTFHAENGSPKPKYYVLDMFPYPSGAGLHVGHPLGYIASDIVARVKRHQGYNVLHPMGFDSFGLPAEQYAILTGKHPADTTAENIERYLEQMKAMGLGYDWSREVRTSDPAFYKWTQWIFLQLFDSWYDTTAQKARPLSELLEIFSTQGSSSVTAACSRSVAFSAEEWNAFPPGQRTTLLNDYRLAYEGVATVNWCAALGTVLSNDEVKDGLSERGGHPVVQLQMQQWFLRITA